VSGKAETQADTGGVALSPGVKLHEQQLQRPQKRWPGRVNVLQSKQKQKQKQPATEYTAVDQPPFAVDQPAPAVDQPAPAVEQPPLADD
jgi:hypothetical protein